MNNTKQILNDLGLGDKEIEVYLELAQNRSLSALQISKETGIDRTTVYDILNKMINIDSVYRCQRASLIDKHFGIVTSRLCQSSCWSSQ